QRPYEGNGSGQFFKGGASFPSEHSAATWAIAGIFAHEYPSPFIRFASYGLATMVSASRITAKQHFPSDVLIGAAIGYLTSAYVYRHHHDPELRGGSWELPEFRPENPSHWQAKYMGSPYVPLDSWIYPALDRLAALGYIDSGFAGMKPWTRNECVRLLGEAGEHIGEGTGGSEAEKLYHLLETEFRSELESAGGDDHPRAKVESVYVRVTNFSGQPLTDGNYFGQTIINDFGRPYQQGFNSVDGVSAWTTSGRWAAYIRAEYQHAPSAPAQPLSARQFIGSVDALPGVPPATPL